MSANTSGCLEIFGTHYGRCEVDMMSVSQVRGLENFRLHIHDITNTHVKHRLHVMP
jgi:hypothetical protein